MFDALELQRMDHCDGALREGVLYDLLGRQYVGSVIVGDSNSRYYEAAPGRSWYAGAGAQYSF